MGATESASREGATDTLRSLPPAFLLATGAALGAYIALDLVGSAAAPAPVVAYCTFVLAGAALGLPPFRPERVSSRSRVFLALASLHILVGKIPQVVRWATGEAVPWPLVFGTRMLALALMVVLGGMALRAYRGASSNPVT